MKGKILAVACFGLSSLLGTQEILECLDGVDEVIEEALETFEVPGVAVGVVHDGRLIYAKGFGYQNIVDKQPVTEDTIFAICSCTKPLTTHVIGALVEEGALNWDDLVIQHLPEFCLKDDYRAKHLTLRDLAAHRTGLSRSDLVWYRSGASSSDLLKKIEHLDFTYGFREKFYYSNLMYVVLGQVIERVTGHSWEEEMQKRIFDPLEMTYSNFSVEDTQNSKNFASPHELRDGKVSVIPFVNVSNIGPAGAINSSVSDLAKWMNIHLSEDSRMLTKDTLHELHSLGCVNSTFPEYPLYFLGYGLGWRISNYHGKYNILHHGSIDGFFSCVSILPEENLGLVILSNRSDVDRLFVDSIAFTIFDKMLNFEAIDWVEKMGESYIKMRQVSHQKEIIEMEPPIRDLEEYEGEYEHPAYAKMTIFIKDGELIAAFNQMVTPLKHQGNEVFLGGKGEENQALIGLRVSFCTDEDGKISALEALFSQDLVIFQKK